MKTISKTFLIIAAVISLAACSSKDNANPSPTTANETNSTTMQQNQNAATSEVSSAADIAKKCANIKAKLRIIDRSATGAQAKIEKLEAQLDSLHCGVK